MSPGGVITLPVSARKALGMKKGEGTKIAVSLARGEVLLTTKFTKGTKTWRLSPRGMMELGGEEKALLAATPTRHYWLKLDDTKRQVRLVPYS
jgi:hypothetical protein